MRRAFKYFIYVDEKYNIIETQGSCFYDDNAIFITEEEYIKSKKYNKFNPETREFSEEITQSEPEEQLSDNQRIEQLEETIGILAEQLAKQTLGM